MGTFEKSYTVDGEQFELYAQTEDGERSFQLVDTQSLPVGEPFGEVPSEEAVAELVRASREVGEAAA